MNNVCFCIKVMFLHDTSGTAGLRLQSVKAAQQYLEEDLRIDFSSAKQLNSEIIKQCVETGVKKQTLSNYISF